MKSRVQDEYRLCIGQYFNSDYVALFARGRVALYAVLRAMGIGPGDEVLVSGYTCVMVPAAILALGATPVYVDIDPRSFNIPLECLVKHKSLKTKAILVQHTYGIPCSMNSIMEWAGLMHLPVIEDCCHAFGSRYDNRLCGTFGSAAFFSGQWNKPFSTGLGGMLVVNDGGIADGVNAIVHAELLQPSRLRERLLTLQLMLYDWLVTPRTSLWITRLYRVLSAVGLTIGSSSNEEFHGKLPTDYFMGLSDSQAKRGIGEMGMIEENIRHRERISGIYQVELPKAGFAPMNLAKEEETVFLRYPVRVSNKKEVLSAAYRSGVEIGSWFESPLHPECVALESFGYKQGCCPEAERAAREVVNLPTHRGIDEARALATVGWLKRYGRKI